MAEPVSTQAKGLTLALVLLDSTGRIVKTSCIAAVLPANLLVMKMSRVFASHLTSAALDLVSMEVPVLPLTLASPVVVPLVSKEVNVRRISMIVLMSIPVRTVDLV
uniref:Uncharacterized protein n=1 Tax=Cacopsylla melanoneura TaxID=428564 RepID=A0A8D8WQV8_9HEMI